MYLWATVLSSSTRSGSLIANGYSSTGTTTTDVSGADDGITYNKYVNAVGSPGWDMIGYDRITSIWRDFYRYNRISSY